MNTESEIKVTTSEVCVSPAHIDTNHSIRDSAFDTLAEDNDSRVINPSVYEDNDLREPLLQL